MHRLLVGSGSFYALRRVAVIKDEEDWTDVVRNIVCHKIGGLKE